MATATDADVAQVLEAVLDRTGSVESLEAERTIEARGRIENLEELVGVAREFDSAQADATPEGPPLELPAGDLALLGSGCAAQRRGG